MVQRRDGAEIDLLDESIRTTAGSLVSTTLYVLSGLVYALVTSPSATGVYFFVSIGVALLLRPIRGVSQALQKLGSERGEPVEPYLGVAVLFAVGYLLFSGVAAALAADTLVRVTVLTEGLLAATGAYAAALALAMVVMRLLAAIGYPSAESWLGSAQSALQLGVVLALGPLVTGAADLLVVVAAVRVALLVPTAVYLGVAPQVPDRRAVGRAWAFARWSVPDQILDRFSYNMPVYVLGVVATPAAVGIYEAADRFADFGATLCWRLSSPLLTRVSGDASIDQDRLTYLDGAITGATGLTVVVLAYLLAAHGVVARVAFPGARATFSATVLLVGVVNVLRGFWTLASHAMEGLGKPSVSFKTKLYGLICSVPITAAAGTEYGALAGAVGYGVLNLVVFAYVVYYARPVLGGVPVDWTLVWQFAVGLGVAFAGTTAVVAGLTAVGVSAVGVAVVAAVACLAVFGTVLWVLSPPTRVVLDRTAALVGDRVGS